MIESEIKNSIGLVEFNSIGLGIEAAAHSFNTDFLPLFKERYDLVIPREKYQRKPISLLLELIRSEDFKRVVAEMDGYDTSETGTVIFVR